MTDIDKIIKSTSRFAGTKHLKKFCVCRHYLFFFNLPFFPDFCLSFTDNVLAFLIFC